MVVLSPAYPLYESIDSMADCATDIVLARITDKRVEELDIAISSDSVSMHTFTIYTLQVDEVYKGNCKTGDSIDVGELGGEKGDVGSVK